MHEQAPLPSQLRVLNLRDNELGMMGVAALASRLERGECPSLSHLHLAINSITSEGEGVPAVNSCTPPGARFVPSPSLGNARERAAEVMNADRCSPLFLPFPLACHVITVAGAAGAEALAAAMPGLPRLAYLELSCNKLTHYYVRNLSTLKECTGMTHDDRVKVRHRVGGWMTAHRHDVVPSVPPPVLLPKPLPSVICRCACLRPQTRANGVRALMASLRHCPLLETLLLDDTDLYVPPTASPTYPTARPDVTRAVVLLLYNQLLIHPRPLTVSCRLQRPWRHAEPVQRHPSRYVPFLLHLSAASPSRLTWTSSPATGSLSSLTHLNLAENCLRAKGITHLSAALSSRAAPAGLSHLHLDGCGMDDDVAPAFLHALRSAPL